MRPNRGTFSGQQVKTGIAQGVVDAGVFGPNLKLPNRVILVGHLEAHVD